MSGGEAPVFEPFLLVIEAFADQLGRNYRAVFGKGEPDHAPIIRATARLALERIAGTDAVYHDVLHTLFVDRRRPSHPARPRHGQGRQPAATGCTSPPPRCCTTSAICAASARATRSGRYVIDAAGNTVTAPRGSTDAFLAPWHVERGKIFVRHRCAAIPSLDVERICRAIELTRFPVPEDGDHAETETEAGLVRAADLIGQLADPAYLRKLAALYFELHEIGLAEKMGCQDPADLAEQYPRFFWTRVEPYVGPALGYLEKTAQGRLWVAQLYAHVFVEEHARGRLGPERGQGR